MFFPRVYLPLAEFWLDAATSPATKTLGMAASVSKYNLERVIQLTWNPHPRSGNRQSWAMANGHARGSWHRDK